MGYLGNWRCLNFDVGNLTVDILTAGERSALRSQHGLAAVHLTYFICMHKCMRWTHVFNNCYVCVCVCVLNLCIQQLQCVCLCWTYVFNNFYADFYDNCHVHVLNKCMYLMFKCWTYVFNNCNVYVLKLCIKQLYVMCMCWTYVFNNFSMYVLKLCIQQL
jgi:hypothetical protein